MASTTSPKIINQTQGIILKLIKNTNNRRKYGSVRRTDTGVRDISVYLLPVFTLSAMTFSYISGLTKITVMIGVVFAAVYLLYHISGRRKTPPEVIVFFVWVIWSGLGALISVDSQTFWAKYFTLIQIAVMLFVVTGISTSVKGFRINFMSLLISIGIVLVISIVIGDLTLDRFGKVGVRVEGGVGNSNMFGICMIIGILIVLFYWRPNQLLLKKWFIYSVIVLFGLAIIASGSRKSFLIMIFMLLMWVIYGYGKGVLKSVFVLPGIAIMLAGVYYIANFTMYETFTGDRMFEITENYEKGYGVYNRVVYMQDGIKMINENPIMGVGLNQFRFHTRVYGSYSHSNYIEVGANTGLVGFAIYYTIFVILWIRLNWIRARTSNEYVLYQIRLFKITLITIFTIYLGSPLYYNKPHWLLLSGIIGYSWWLKSVIRHDIRRKRMEIIKSARTRIRAKKIGVGTK